MKLKRVLLPVVLFLTLIATAFAASKPVSDDFISDMIKQKLAADSVVKGGAIEVIAPPLTTESAASFCLIMSEIKSSETGLDAAKAVAINVRNRTTGSNTRLSFISSAHCTPIDRVEIRCLLAPRRFHFDMQIEVDVRVEQGFHFLPRECADLFQHRTFRSDDDRLLAVAFHQNRSEDA